MQFILIAIVAVILPVGVASSCPSVCNCHDHLYLVKVNCSSRGLDSIPTDLPTDTEYCKSVTTKRVCCICNIYYFACMKNEDANGVTAHQRTDNDKREK